MSVQQTLYTHDNSKLYAYDPATNTFTLIGSTNHSLTDVAVAPNGAAYGIGFSTLYTLNLSSGAADNAINLGRNDLNAMVVDNTGRAFVAGNTSNTIYQVELSTGALTPFATSTSYSAGDLIVLNDKLYLSTTNGTLESFDLASGARLGSVQHGISDVWGMAIGEYGTVYAFADNRVYALDLVTGEATLTTTFPAGYTAYGATQSSPNWQQWYTGASGSDVLSGSTGNDMIAGLDGNDVLHGHAGDDCLIGGAGDDILNGHGGLDTASYASTLTGHTIIRTANGHTVAGEGDGSDSLSGIEKVQFADMTVNLTIQTAAAVAPAADVQRLMELYVAFFNRIPDADGLEYWIGQYRAGQSINQIAESFYNAGIQYSDLTGFSSSMSHGDFVHVVYKNVLGRAEGADAEGLAYWSGKLADGSATHGSLVSDILGTAHTFKGNSTWGWVADLLDNKLSVAHTFAVDMGLNYNDASDSIANGMEIAAAVSASSTTDAIRLIGINPDNLDLA